MGSWAQNQHDPAHQAFSAFADLTIKSLADIEEEVGVARGYWDPPILPLPHPTSLGLIAQSLSVPLFLGYPPPP